MTTNGAELFEVDFSVSVLVCEEDGLIHDLLQLSVCEVSAHHHLQHLEQFPIRDEAIFVHVVDLEGN